MRRNARRTCRARVIRFVGASAFVFFTWAAPALNADTVYFKDGRKWEGIILKQEEDRVMLDLGFDVAKLERHKIARIEISTPGANAAIRQRLDEKKRVADLRRKEWELLPKDIPLEEWNGHLVAAVLLNGNQRVRLLIDTGASVIVLPRRIGEKLGIPFQRSSRTVQLKAAGGRKLKAALIVLDRVKILNVEARNVQAAVLLDRNADDEFQDGLLGMSFLRQFNFSIDYNHKEITLQRLGDAGQSGRVAA